MPVPERPNQTALNARFEFDALRLANNYRRAILREFASELRGRVLEIGAGIGQFTALLRSLPAVNHLLAVEPDAALAAEFRAANPTQPLLHGTSADLIDPEPWNAIVSVNVLEHIRDDAGELARCRRLLAERRGQLCLFVPARPEIFAPLDRDFGHFRRYTRDGLRTVLTDAGFEVVRLDYFNCVGYLAWWFNFCLLARRHFTPASVRLYDRVIFPVVHACERTLGRPPIGQSLLAVARAA